MRHLYSKEEEQFLKDNVKGISLKELTEKFNKQFNFNLSESAIESRKNKLGLHSGIVGGQFQKGHVPFNKGTKGLIKPNKTSFKKGNIPANHKPIGSERISKDGYIEIKIQDGQLNKNWQLKHRYIYEKEYGPIPDGYNIIFLDGDRQNLELSNLKLVSKAEDLIMNKRQLFTNDKELTTTGTLIAKVIDKTYKMQINKEK